MLLNPQVVQSGNIKVREKRHQQKDCLKSILHISSVLPYYSVYRTFFVNLIIHVILGTPLN